MPTTRAASVRLRAGGGVYSKDWAELYRYIEYPAIYHKDRLLGHFRAARPGRRGADEGAQRERHRRLLDSPLFDVWAHAAIAEILSALYERRVTAAQRSQ